MDRIVCGDLITIWGLAWLGWDITTDWSDIYTWRGLADSGFVWLQLNLTLCTFGRLKRWEALHSWYTEEVRGSVLFMIHFCHMWITHGGCTWYWLLAPHLHWADRGPPVPCVSWIWLASFSYGEGLRWDLPIIDKWNKCRFTKVLGANVSPYKLDITIMFH